MQIASIKIHVVFTKQLQLDHEYGSTNDCVGLYRIATIDLLFKLLIVQLCTILGEVQYAHHRNKDKPPLLKQFSRYVCTHMCIAMVTLSTMSHAQVGKKKLTVISPA